jgi:hypothetical protein
MPFLGIQPSRNLYVFSYLKAIFIWVLLRLHLYRHDSLHYWLLAINSTISSCALLRHWLELKVPPL